MTINRNEEATKEETELLSDTWKDFHRQNQMIGSVVEYFDTGSELMNAQSQELIRVNE